MSIPPDLAPEPHPVLAGAREITAVLDRMHACATPVTAGDVAAVVGDLDKITRRVQSLKLRVLAEESAAAAARDAGFADTGSWLSRQTRATGRDAARDVRLAEDLTARTTTRAALGAGRLSPDHARVITEALDRLPDTLTDVEQHAVEEDLVARAEKHDPARLRKEARRALAAVEPDPTIVDAHEDQQVADEEDSAQTRSRLTFHDNGDGTVSGSFTVPTLAGDVLRKVIEAMTAPRRQGISTSGVGAADPVDWAHRRGAAFVELLEHLPTDHLHAKTAATVVVQLRYEVLLGALATAGLDTDSTVSAATARRLACSAGIIPTVLGGRSLPLDLGREQRLFTEAQRVAVGTRHTHCAAAGCQRPFAWCELHHAKPWSQGGRTDLDQAVPLCGYHHRLVHHADYRHQDTTEGIVFTRRGCSRQARPTRAALPVPAARTSKADAARPPAPRARPTAPMRT